MYCHLVPHLYCMHAAERERCTFVCSQICTLASHFKSAPLLLLLSSFPYVCFHPPFTKSAVHHNPKTASLFLLSSTALSSADFLYTKPNSLSLSFSWSCYVSSSSCLATSTCILATFSIRSSCTPTDWFRCHRLSQLNTNIAYQNKYQYQVLITNTIAKYQILGQMPVTVF